MGNERSLEGKRILAVDDEPDVLDALEDLLNMCTVEKATSFEEAKQMLENRNYDVAILDIMGVDGYELLDIANGRGITAVMLTAHALSPDNVVKSFKEGAASYVPKDKLSEIADFLADVFEAQAKGKHTWWRWLDRLSERYCEKKFGPGWKDKNRDFWNNFGAWE